MPPRSCQPRSTFSGLTLLLVVAMAFQLGGHSVLPGGGDGHGCGNRVVQELPALAQSQIVRRVAQQDRRVPAEAVGQVRFSRREHSRRDLSRESLVVGPARARLFGELDLPPPSVG